MDSKVALPHTYQLGPFEIKGKENVLATADSSVVLLPKVMALLLYLCRHSQQVVTFDELNQAIWPREVVGDNAIYNLVGQLRKVLKDSASKPTYIQTVSKTGYRLLVKAEPLFIAEVCNTPPVKGDAAKVKQTRLNWIIATLVILGLFASAALLMRAFEQKSPELQRQLQLAYYQLYRGDNKGLDQAIDTLQQLAAMQPSWAVPKLELAYAFLRKAKRYPQKKDIWLSKAQAISMAHRQGDAGSRLSALVKVRLSQGKDTEQLARLFSGKDILTSARLVYADILFEQGLASDALTQLLLALDACMDCPYVYRRLATTQMVMGLVQEGFDSFSRYRLLISRTSENPLEKAGYVVLTKQNLQEMANWHYQTPITPPLLAHQRNTLALFYLTLGQVDAAQQLLASSSASLTHFFDLYTHAAVLGAKGEFEASHALLQKRQNLYPDNERFKLSVVFSLWQLGRYHEAMSAIRQFELPIATDPVPETMPFPLWSLYAALLLEVGDAKLGNEVLAVLESQLKSGLLPGSHEADIRLASVLALQGKNKQALTQLDLAISQGWVSDFNQNWWNIQHSPYFRNLRAEPKFQRLVSEYHQSIAILNTQAKSQHPKQLKEFHSD